MLIELELLQSKDNRLVDPARLRRVLIDQEENVCPFSNLLFSISDLIRRIFSW